MKLYAVVTTDRDTPDEPELIAAWPARWIDDEPSPPRDLDENGDPWSCLDMARGDPSTLAAAIVAIDIPDDQLLPLLTPAVPTVTGTASVVD
ncbi:hypothetical protein [Amycolatopsis sp. NBC_01480]|uniref:hypothetical protein n=1 Tax=Amycolatopsis sp. NBC_01480 TaxID=2903562 RepID=UPI002E2DCF00|nr:hypothetical protein [Amycolatopsis sp. NBC_01480]